MNDEVIQLWSKKIQERALPRYAQLPDDQLEQVLLPLYNCVENAANGQYSELDLQDWVLAERMDRGCDLADAIEILETLRSSISAASGTAKERLVRVEHWEPALSWAMKQLALDFTEAIEATLLERLKEAELLAGRLSVATEQADLSLLRLNTLYDTARQLNETLDLEETLQLVLERARRVIHSNQGIVWLIEEKSLTAVAVTGIEDILWKQWRVSLSSVLPLIERTVREGHPISIKKTLHSTDGFSRILAKLDGDSVLLVPLALKNEPIGIVTLNGNAVNASSHEEYETLQSMAYQASAAIANARMFSQIKRFNVELEQRIQERTAELATINDITQAVTATLDLQEVLGLVTKQISSLFAVERGSLLLLDEKTNQLYFAMALGTDLKKLKDYRVPIGKGIVGWVVQEGKPALVSDVLRDTRFFSKVSDDLKIDVRSILCVPLRVRGRIIGALELMDGRPDVFKEEDLQRLKPMTSSIAIAIDNARLYEHLQQANEHLVELNQARLEFVSSVSHELRAPMTSIRGFTDILLQGAGGELNEDQRKYLKIVRSNAERLTVMVNDLLEISRLEARRTRLNMRELAFEDVIREVEMSLDGHRVTKNIDLTVDIPPDLPRVRGDRERLLQVMTNLLNNAYKYTPEGGSVKVSVDTQRIRDEDEVRSYLLVKVADTGIGISKADQHNLFQRFFRSDNPEVRKVTGTGLGLYIVKSLVELHEGRIWAKSQLGEGTTFNFLLPTTQNDAEIDDE